MIRLRLFVPGKKHRHDFFFVWEKHPSILPAPFCARRVVRTILFSLLMEGHPLLTFTLDLILFPTRKAGTLQGNYCNGSVRYHLIPTCSGGTSALLVSPLPGLSLNSKMLVNQMLIRSGASIQEINAVRKHLSSVKGGQLARYTGNLKCLVLVISDVIGDDLSTIGSGPFYPDPSTFLDARRILQQYQLWDQVPEDVREILQNGIGGTLPETPKSNPAGIPHIIVGSNEIARLAAAERAKQLGYEVDLWPESLSALVGEVATLFEDSIRKNGSNRALIAGGEITIRVQGTGMGGRNQHLALLMAQKIAGKNIVFGAIGTDGIDGNSPAAGAWADGQTFDRASGEETFRSAVEECDSYHYFQRIGQNIVTGPTGTNVMDLYVALT